MEIIKIQGIGQDDIDVEGAIEGVGTEYVEGQTAVFKIESESEDKVLEVRAQKVPFWTFSIGPFAGDFQRNPQWRNSRYTLQSPLLTEVLEIEVPEDAVIERVS